jgi:predicted nicotinamide N-methyase
MAGKTSVQIQGDPPVIEEIAAVISGSDEAELVRTESSDQAGIGADFALETVAVIIAIVSDVFFDKPIVPALFKILRRHKGTKITIETPTRTVSIESTADLSEESLQRILAAVTA